jgi:hypothetical protein
MPALKRMNARLIKKELVEALGLDPQNVKVKWLRGSGYYHLHVDVYEDTCGVVAYAPGGLVARVEDFCKQAKSRWHHEMLLVNPRTLCGRMLWPGEMD